MTINSQGKHFQTLGEEIRSAQDKKITIKNCMGQRYIASGLSGKDITIEGTPGNALGAYLDGSTITVRGNVQDATGDTMNDGAIYVDGQAGDATGYAMRGGKIFIHGDVGYRAGIHMKEYQDKIPALVVGGRAGSFLGEYQAGGIIVILGLHCDAQVPVGYFCGTGMHGGKIFLRCKTLPDDLPAQVQASQATQDDLDEIRPLVHEFCTAFGEDEDHIMKSSFFVLTPNTKNPYQRLYTPN